MSPVRQLGPRCGAVDDDPDFGTGEACELEEHDAGEMHSTRGGQVNWRARPRVVVPLKRVASR